ncbi:UNVERIFIED_CONTAM: hypothetical protein RMT77_006552 [Armadillidium vulgare]
MVSYAKYSLVPTEDPKDKAENKSAPSGAFDYSSAFNYKSAFEYNSNNPSHYQSAFDYGYGPKKNSSLGIEKERKKKRESFSLMDCITAFVTGISYFIIGITFPCTLWFCIKRLKQWERLIVFRIGRLRGVLGPGIVFVVPWIDRYTRVDMRTKAFSVPPQQLITVDNGIIEMGCEVKYRVSDVQQLTTSVITPQHGLRSFGKTVMLNVLTKHTVREMERDRLQIASEILKELNTRVANWGIEIGQVDLSTVNVLKEPEPNNPLKPLLSALGSSGSSGSPVATGPDGFFGAGGKPGMVASGILEGGMATIPPVVSKGSSSLLDFSTLAKISGLGGFQGFSITGMEKKKARPEAAGNHDKMNTDLIQLLDDTNSKSNNSLYSKQRPKDKEVTGSSSAKTKLGRYLQSLVEGPGGSDLSHGVYRLQVEGVDAGVYIIFVGNGMRQVVEGDLPKLTPDVSVVVSKDDLTAVLEGSLPPLQAYLSGRLTVTGNIQLLMGLESLRQANLIQNNEPDDIFIV